MKIKISETTRRTAKIMRADLQAAYDDFAGSNGEAAKLQRRQQTISAEIERIEGAADPSDRKAISSLGELKTELEFVSRRLDTISGVGTPKGEKLALLLHGASQLIRTALSPAQKEYESEIAAVMEPYFSAKLGNAKAKARESDAATAFGVFIHRGYSGQSLGEASMALNVLDEILAGKLSWKFDPTA